MPAFYTLVSVEGKEDDEKETTEPPSKRVKHKKSVTWPNDNDLTEVFFFELDEEERGNCFYLLRVIISIVCLRQSHD